MIVGGGAIEELIKKGWIKEFRLKRKGRIERKYHMRNDVGGGVTNLMCVYILTHTLPQRRV